VITVTAVQRIRPGRTALVDSLMADLTQQVVLNEPGCAGFDYVVAPDDSLTRLVLERYVDEDAHRQHAATPYLAAFLPRLMECLTEAPQVTVYQDVVAVPALPASFFHIGVVVPDLERACARYREVLGLEFTDPAVFDVPCLEDPDPHPFKLTAVFSRTAPPYYELIQADGNGIVSADKAGQILYFGCWESDMAGRLKALAKAGVGVDATFRNAPDHVPFAIMTAPDLCGARIEYVDIADLAQIAQWVRTGRWPADQGVPVSRGRAGSPGGTRP
jgi:quinol monooxygenase YgiN/catechol 2,3-dioxygenase-like lactoylglutathione lyase family enzyme